MNEREQFVAQSKEMLDAFVREHPQYTIDTEQPTYRGGTNYITFGHLGTEPVVFKSFVRTYRWAHEYFCLRHFAQTGYVPQILDVVPEHLIVMERLRDTPMELDLAQRTAVSRQLGQAVAILVQWPLPTAQERPAVTSEFEHFAWRSDVEEIVRECVALCRQIHARLPLYQTDFFAASLDLVEAQIGYIAQQPRMLFHEDLPNFSLHQGQFQGFYDLEMMRIGTAALQLGVAVNLIQPHWLDEEWLIWSAFLQSYQATAGKLLSEADSDAILAMSHFYYHIRLCDWGKWDGDLSQTSRLAFAMEVAEPYFKAMTRACYNLRAWVDLNRWFPMLEEL